MIDRSALETRIETLISAYADQAPTDVDPVAMTRSAAAGRGRARAMPRAIMRPTPGLAFVLLILGLALALVAGALLAGGRPSQHDPERTLTKGFVGLPPVGAAPSTPEQGDLVLAFVGRPDTFDSALYHVWVYADGRLIWAREGYLPFGVSESTTGLLEQRLGPEGVELLRSDSGPVWSHRGDLALDRSSDGVSWARMWMRNDEGELEGRAVSRLPASLADPTGRLPVTAWQDPAVREFVPSRYAVCGATVAGDHWSSYLPFLLEYVPVAVADVVRADGSSVAGPASSSCVGVPTEAAREIVARLEDAGLERLWPQASLTYRIEAPGPDTLFIWPILPHGWVMCQSCG